ncbi:MAG TPA: type II toxin-antitoxin system prevent-host-death family antitoxin [Longimicrobiaceae bacterium]
MNTWEMDDAKNRFGEVVRRALMHAAQRVTVNSRDAVVVLSADDYERLVTPLGLVEFLRDSPLAEALAADEIEIDRSRELDEAT